MGRAVVVLLLLPGCLTAPQLQSGPARWLPDVGNWAKLQPARGCVQIEARRGRRSYYPAGLRKNGHHVGDGMKRLPEITRDFAPAYDLAVTARHEERAAYASVALGFMGAAGLMAARIGLILQPDSSTTANVMPLLGGFGSMLIGDTLLAILLSRSSAHNAMAVEAYDRYASDHQAEGCPDPLAPPAAEPAAEGPPAPATADPWVERPPPDTRTRAERAADVTRETWHLLDLAEEIERAAQAAKRH